MEGEFLKRIEELGSRLWEQRRRDLPRELAEQGERALLGCRGEEAAVLRWELATLPLWDLGEYGPELFLGEARQALAAREEFPWGRELPDALFLREVACPRVNNEGLAPCRELFRGELAPRVRGLSLKEAILEVNRWCAGKVTYRASDDRTASALEVVRRGYGRCGEESLFLVNALRSVAIPARQVYAPWWSHCDDNHAWVEAWDGNTWRYLGACEPEPVLDRGWFTGAAARAMLLHARSFYPGDLGEGAFLYPGVDPLDLDQREGVVYESLTHRYGDTVPLRVTVTDESGKPVPGAKVSFSVLNMSRFLEIAARVTGPQGTAALRVGKGSLRVAASLSGKTAACLVNTGEDREVTLALEEPGPGETDWNLFEFQAPEAPRDYPPVLTGEQERKRRLDLEEAARCRQAGQAGKAASCREDWEEEILATLPEKDREAGVPQEVLADSRQAFAWEEGLPERVFREGLLCPRVGLEPLTPWRDLGEQFPPQQRQAFRQEPERLWHWVEERVAEDRRWFSQIPSSPGAALKLGRCAPGGREVLFCALCRSLGIPAKLDGPGRPPLCWKEGAYHPAWSQEVPGELRLLSPQGREAREGQNFSLSRWDGEAWAPAWAGEEAFREGAALVPGRYLLLTAERLPGGGQLAKAREFTLEEGEAREILLSFQQPGPDRLLTSLPLPPFSLEDQGGRTDSASLLARRPLSLLVWLEPGREPTEHILNELREAAEGFVQRRGQCQILLMREQGGGDPTLDRALEALPQARVLPQESLGGEEGLARRMFVEPGRYPLLLLADRQGNGLFACAGYNVGTGELLLKLLDAALTERRKTG